MTKKPQPAGARRVGLNEKQIDLLTIGRVSMDLFARDIGAPFVDITSFAAHVGGSPVNIAIAGSRLGLRTAVLTAVGLDEVGKFVIHTLAKEGVETQFIPQLSEGKTGLAVVGIEPPDHFPLVFYRENPADIYLTPEHLTLSLDRCRALLLSGTALSRGSVFETTFLAAARAQEAGTIVFLDLDLRPDQWHHPLSFGVNIRALLPLVDVVIGTEEEMFAGLAPRAVAASQGIRLQPAEKEQLPGLIKDWIQRAAGPNTFILKRGAAGVSVFDRGYPEEQVAAYQVEVLNTVGAGDAFAAGLIAGYLKGETWTGAASLGNASGALVVTRHGCAAAMPTTVEVAEFMEHAVPVTA